METKPDPQVLRLTRKQVEALLSDSYVDTYDVSGKAIRVDLVTEGAAVSIPTRAALSQEAKVDLFASLFVGREDVYSVRWESKTGKSGYSPVCENQWKPGICQLPRIKCSDCLHRKYSPMAPSVLESHLRGEKVVGLYPLLPDSSCLLLAFDCDGHDWLADSQAILATIRGWGLAGYLERSRSGDGAHVWIFFTAPVQARMARLLGTAILTKTMESRPEIGLRSYDRMFPNQDWMPEGGFGNLIALPLQKVPRAKGNSVFLDDDGVPFADQWAHLSEIRKVTPGEVADRINDSARSGNVLDIPAVSNDEDSEDKWSRVPEMSDGLLAVSSAHSSPSTLGTVIVRLDGEVSVPLVNEEDKPLPASVKNRLIRLAAFQNPEFYQAQRLRLNTHLIPRVIGCAVEDSGWLKLPRGLHSELISCLDEMGGKPDVQDERNTGSPIEVNFQGTLRDDQKKVLNTVLANETGIVSAPTGFGKTVLACSVLASRKVNTLILVHRSQLLDQWRTQLQSLLGLKRKEIGVIGKGTRRPTGRIDVATIQSLYQNQKVDPLVAEYGQIIVDECHHVSAFSFEQVLRTASARFVLGLTATPIRRDGLHPIMFMQCGPLRVKVKRDKSNAAHRQEVVWRSIPSSPALSTEMGMTDLYAVLAQNEKRTECVVEDVLGCLAEGRFPLVLTERKAHLDSIHKGLLAKSDASIAVLYGGQGKKARAEAMALAEAKDGTQRVVLATGKLVGEGFDLPDLDTLLIALPISWRGTLQQYVGRLSRITATKSLVRVIDYEDLGHPILSKMAERRRAGYKMLGFRPQTEEGPDSKAL